LIDPSGGIIRQTDKYHTREDRNKSRKKIIKLSGNNKLYNLNFKEKKIAKNTTIQ
jgi:hypothetical protein